MNLLVATSRWLRAGLLIFTLLAFCHTALPEDASKSSEGISADATPTAMHPLVRRAYESAGSLQSGEFHGTWTEWKKSPIADECYGYQLPMDGLFSDAQHAYAIKRPVRSLVRDKQVNSIYGLIRTDRQAIRYGGINGMIMSRPPGDQFERGPLPTGEYLDPRLFALTWSTALARGMTWTAEPALGSIGRSANPSITIQGALHTLEWETDHQLITFTLEVDGDVVLARKLIRQARYPDVDDNLWSPPLELQELKWSQAEEHFVPAEWTLAETTEVLIPGQPLPRNREERKFSTRTIEVHLNWTRVNETIPSAEFSEQWFSSKEAGGNP